MDIAIASIHGPCYKGERTEEAITAAYLAAMENPLIHIIGHPDDGRYPVDYEQLAKKAKETGTVLEVNNGSLRPGGFRVDTRKNDLKMLEYCKKYEVPVTMGSDAHMDVDLADYSYALPVIEESHFPEELIVNTSAELLKSCIRYKRNMWKQKKGKKVGLFHSCALRLVVLQKKMERNRGGRKTGNRQRQEILCRIWGREIGALKYREFQVQKTERLLAILSAGLAMALLCQIFVPT